MTTMDHSKTDPRRVRARVAATMLTGVAMWWLAAVSGALLLWPEPPDWVGYVLMGGFLTTCVVGIALFVKSGAYVVGSLRATQKSREFAQWDRWQSCLYIFPALMTALTFLALREVREWQAGDHNVFYLAFPLLVPLYPLFVAARFFPERPGPGGSWRRRFYDELSDDLSREHARIAFRTGYLASCLGVAAIVYTALAAPQWAAQAAIAAGWLAFVVPCVRFGLLQRGAED